MNKWRHRIHERIAQGRPLAFRDRLFAKRRAYAADVARLTELMAYSAPPVQPSRALREQVLAAASSTVTVDLAVVRTAERRFRRLLPGIEICLLSQSAHYRSVLLKLSAGSTLPAHEHPQIEQAMVLEGSCFSGSLYLKAGDFYLAQAQTWHEPVRAIEDCTMLVITHS
jgi:quercetin dioxygenase-like cupin family protein